MYEIIKNGNKSVKDNKSTSGKKAKEKSLFSYVKNKKMKKI